MSFFIHEVQKLFCCFVLTQTLNHFFISLSKVVHFNFFSKSLVIHKNHGICTEEWFSSAAKTQSMALSNSNTPSQTKTCHFALMLSAFKAMKRFFVQGAKSTPPCRALSPWRQPAPDSSGGRGRPPSVCTFHPVSQVPPRF